MCISLSFVGGAVRLRPRRGKPRGKERGNDVARPQQRRKLFRIERARPFRVDPSRRLVQARPPMSVGQHQVLLVGPVRLLRDEVPVPLPRSRKVLALLAYLALDGTQQSRTRLCDLLWDGPNDPRGELRWCLSKLRSLVDDADRPRVVANGNTFVRLDLSDVTFDARAVERSAKAGISEATTEQLVFDLSLFRGELLEGLELDGTP